MLVSWATTVIPIRRGLFVPTLSQVARTSISLSWPGTLSFQHPEAELLQNIVSGAFAEDRLCPAIYLQHEEDSQN